MIYASVNPLYHTAVSDAAMSALTKLAIDRPKAKPQEIWVHPESFDQMLADLRVKKSCKEPICVWHVPILTAEQAPLDEVVIMGMTEQGEYRILMRMQLPLVNFEGI